MVRHCIDLLRSVACLVVICLTPAWGQDVSILRGVTLIDGTGAPHQQNVDVLVSGTTIVRVEPTGTTTAGTVHDYRGKFLLPGLISAHSHVGQVNGTSQSPANYNRDNILRQLRQYEVYGVTTIVALGTNQKLFYEIRKEAHDGTIPGADLFGADRGIGVRNGVPGGQVLAATEDQIDRPGTAEQARAAVRAAKERGTDFIKMWVDDSYGTVPKMTKEVYTATIDEAHRQGLRVTAHIFSLNDAKALVAAGVDVIAHGVRDQPVDHEFIEAMKKNSVWYIATLGLNDAVFIFAEHPEWLDDPFFQHALQPALKAQFADAAWREKTLAAPATNRARDAVRMNQRNLAILHDAGVRIGFGTDSGAMPLRIPGFMEHRELALMVEAGLSPQESLAIATSGSAALLGLDDRGTIQAGKLADLLVLDADPAEDILNSRKIHAVWRRGKPVSGPVTGFTP